MSQPALRPDGTPAAGAAGGRASPAMPAATPAPPERPRLAPGIKLAGQMRESAFVDPPWLIEREDSGYIQVTELIYRIAEHATGENTVEEIAAKISDAGTPVNPQTVRGLIARLLVPRGLVVGADGNAISVQPLASPLALNMRMKMVSPRVIDPITRVLQWFYWPPVLVVLLVVAIAAHAWVFAFHGVAGSVRETLYSPALTLVIIGLIVLSAAFHEFGHASALRYGGGRVKTMGAGFYLIYPAFYTDVSDNYRLGRWARIRTDLGGFYFNLLFGLGVMVAYLITGQQFLLLAIVMLFFATFYQILPFIRLDGYWLLADLTGIPDFFSLMGAFWRSVLPIPGWKGDKLPPLKWWGKAVFVGYTLITLPLLVFLFYVLIQSLPRVLATGWDSLLQQMDTFGQARGGGDLLSMVAAVVQMLILVIITFGPVVVFANLGRKGILALWRWGGTSPARRAVSVMGTAGATALLAFLWLPQVPLIGQPGPAFGYVTANFRPIVPEERGTVGEAVISPPFRAAEPMATPTSANVTPAPAAATPASASPTPAPTAATPTILPGLAPATLTAVPSPAPTPPSPPPPARGAAPATATPTPVAAGANQSPGTAGGATTGEPSAPPAAPTSPATPTPCSTATPGTATPGPVSGSAPTATPAPCPSPTR